MSVNRTLEFKDPFEDILKILDKEIHLGESKVDAFFKIIQKDISALFIRHFHQHQPQQVNPGPGELNPLDPHPRVQDQTLDLSLYQINVIHPWPQIMSLKAGHIARS